MPRHIERERLHFCGVDVQDIVNHYVEKHWGDSIRKTMAKYRTDDHNGKETEMESETNTKHTGLDVGPKAGKAELVTEDLLRKAWARGHRYVKEPDGRMLTLMIGNHPDGATAYMLHDIATGDEVDRVRAKSLWSSTREQADAFDWIGTTPEGKRVGMDVGAPLTRGPVSNSLPESTLDDCVEHLPDGHRARLELDRLRDEVDVAEAIDLRAERVRVASRVLAAIITVNPPSPVEEAASELRKRLVHTAVKVADNLLARIDETEPKDVL